MWETDTAIINPLINMNINSSEMPYANRGVHIATIELEIESKISAMLLTCSPGRSPVAIPTVTPRMQNIIMSANSSN